MCGIALTINGTERETMRMGEAIKHRGYIHGYTQVDKLKVWFSSLPITDVDADMQPFRTGTWVVWLNGYISNYKELAARHKIPMETTCDTELLAKFIDKYGCTRLSELNGFFSVVAYNEKTKEPPTVFTDRYGIKQLYHYKREETTYICSEIKGILAVNQLEISERGAENWLHNLGVMNEHSIYQDVFRIRSVHFPIPKPRQISYHEAKERLSLLLARSLDRNKAPQGIPDGVFLSGGVDSGLLANKLNPDFCFSMDYQDEQFSEIQNIKRNSNGIHLSMICNEKLFNKYKHVAADILDDPKAGSCYTNTALTEFAAKYCTILYSGAGGDEVFDGYTHRYNRPIKDVIRRTDFETQFIHPDITHKEYDWLFLKSVLVVEDRMSGFNTLETRYPLLDNDFVDFALSLPPEYRKDKRILKDISGLDPVVLQGKKRGFSNPYMTNWEWAQFVLNKKRKHEHALD